MGLVGYSDSEGSDDETSATAPIAPAPVSRAGKSGFQKVIDPAAPRKIKVELPSVKPEIKEEEERPTKKARTGGLAGFNSFLPAPKRTAEKKSGLGAGVNLRTGAEPAFSRERVEPDLPVPAKLDQNIEGDESRVAPATHVEEEKPIDVKIVGNAMRFKPLSVANKKAKKKPANQPPTSELPAPQKTQSAALLTSEAPLPKMKKVSLFSVAQEQPESKLEVKSSEYQPILAEATQPESSEEVSTAASFQPVSAPAPANPNSLDAIAADLNLSESARRQLFGRNKDAAAAAKIMHFDMEQEYASNEVLRQQGQAQEHRVAKAVAPGKHSLQQLVNAASTQKEALEDKWAEGKRNKAEGGSRYGW